MSKFAINVLKKVVKDCKFYQRCHDGGGTNKNNTVCERCAFREKFVTGMGGPIY